MLNQHLLKMTDVEAATADGSLVYRSDAYETRQQSAVPPINIPRDISFRTQLFWTRHIVDANYTLNASTEIDRANSFHLSDIPNYTNWTTIFDQYAIVCVVATVGAQFNSVTATAPRMYTAIDHDDDNPDTISGLQQNPTCEESYIYQRQKRMIYPRVATGAYSGAFTSFTNTRIWIDSGSPSVAHYGFKISCETDPSASVLHANFVYYVVFRNVRNN